MKPAPLVIALSALLCTAAGSVLASQYAARVVTGRFVHPLTRLQRLCDEHSIELIFEPDAFPIEQRHPLIECDYAEEDEINEFAAVLVTELEIYPPRFMAATELRRIVICDRLTRGDAKPGAMVDLSNDTLYFDVLAFGWSPRRERMAIHHELFHIVDYRDDGIIYDDAEWKNLNPSSFQYGEGGKDYLKQLPYPFPAVRTPGFISGYSKSGVEEDKAEIYARLIVRHDYVELRAREDPVIRAKVKMMKSLLIHFSSDMGPQFWDAARRAPR
jgi:hypothetical protein